MDGKKAFYKILLLIILISVFGSVYAVSPDKPSLNYVWQIIKDKKFVDLTHSFYPGIPHWEGFNDEKRDLLYWYNPGEMRPSRGYGFFAELFSFVGQWGTHVDAPAHFAKGKRTLDQINPEEMILPLVVLDVHEKVNRNPDYTVTMQDVWAWEKKHGVIPKRAFVALRTDWSKRWPNQEAMHNKDKFGESHYPGWSLPVLQYLYATRKITASGHETTDTDPGVEVSKNNYALESYVLGTDHYQVELLTNLDLVPEAGALVVVAFPKPRGGSGFPARVFAILP